MNARQDLKQETARLRWQCRRGLLELDILFSDFLEREYASLSAREQTLFHELLANPDPDLLTWFMGQQRPDRNDFRPLIEKIKRASVPGS